MEEHPCSELVDQDVDKSSTSNKYHDKHLINEKKEGAFREKTGHSTWSTLAETHRNRCHLVSVKTGLDGTSHIMRTLVCNLDKHGAGMH